MNMCAGGYHYWSWTSASTSKDIAEPPRKRCDCGIVSRDDLDPLRQTSAERDAALAEVERLRVAIEAHCHAFEASSAPGMALVVGDLRAALLAAVPATASEYDAAQTEIARIRAALEAVPRYSFHPSAEDD